MKKVGVTGGIGSGKSLVCEAFKALRIPVYHTDTEAHRLMEAPGLLRDGLAGLFGEAVVTPQGLDRKRMASMLFADVALVKRVNSLVHPVVMQDFAAWAGRQRAPYVLLESAILFETGLYKAMDAMVLVCAPRELRMERVLGRDATTRSAVSRRMQHQDEEDAHLSLADFIIHNDNIQPIVPQVLQIHAQLTGRL